MTVLLRSFCSSSVGCPLEARCLTELSLIFQQEKRENQERNGERGREKSNGLLGLERTGGGGGVLVREETSFLMASLHFFFQDWTLDVGPKRSIAIFFFGKLFCSAMV